MRKFCKSEKEQIRQIIVESEIMRLSLQETAILVKERMGKDLSSSYISDIRGKLREKGKQYISILARNRDTYVSEYLTLIEGAKFSEGELYKIALNSNSTNTEKIAAHKELAYKMVIAELMYAMPAIFVLQQQNNNAQNFKTKQLEDQGMLGPNPEYVF